MQKFYIDQNGKLAGSYDGPDETNPYAGMTEAPTPPAFTGQTWNASAWIHAKPALKEIAADKRFRMETGGLMVGGMPIATDRNSQNMISGAAKLFDEDPALSVIEWTASPDSFVTLTKVQLKAIGVAVGRHVQRCFARQKEIAALIDAGTITTAEQIEAWEGWTL